MLPLLLASLALSVVPSSAFDMSRSDNLAVYWGQNSYGAAGGPSSGWQSSLATYCQDDVIDTIPIAFLTVYNSVGGLPEVNLANICSSNTGVFPGTNLANCQFLANDIKTCQAKGKMLSLSLGGATGANAFANDDAARTFAQLVWDLFLGGTHATRPFGDAVLDGVDLDIEGGSSVGYVAFVQKIRDLASGASKKHYVTGAPQCPFPDAFLGSVINAVGFDALYVQFYNNYCGVNSYPSSYNFATWDDWAKNTSPNKDVKIYIGAPAGPTGANPGYYVDSATLINIVKDTRAKYSSFGGVMLWDVSQAYANNRYDQAIKNALVPGGGTSPTTSSTKATTSTSTTVKTTTSPTTTTAPSTTTQSTTTATTTTASPGSGSCAGVAAWDSGKAYNGGEQVTYNGHLWTAKWWNQAETPGGSSGAWTDAGACSSSKAKATGSKRALPTATHVPSIAIRRPTPQPTRVSSRHFRF